MRVRLNPRAIIESSESTTVDTYLRIGSQACSAGDTPVAFSSTIGTTNYSLVYRAYNSSGETVGVTISGKGATGFTVTAPEACTLEYAVIKNN